MLRDQKVPKRCATAEALSEIMSPRPNQRDTARSASWAATWSGRSDRSEPMARSQSWTTARDDGVGQAELVLQKCEERMQELEHLVQTLHIQAVNSGTLSETTASSVSPRSSPAKEVTAAGLKAACLELSRQLQELAADALERGCKRVPGAMDVFEQANAALERVARCMQDCHSPAPEEPQVQQRDGGSDLSEGEVARRATPGSLPPPVPVSLSMTELC